MKSASMEGQTGEIFFVDDESTGTEGDDEDEGWDFYGVF